MTSARAGPGSRSVPGDPGLRPLQADVDSRARCGPASSDLVARCISATGSEVPVSTGERRARNRRPGGDGPRGAGRAARALNRDPAPVPLRRSQARAGHWLAPAVAAGGEEPRRLRDPGSPSREPAGGPLASDGRSAVSVRREPARPGCRRLPRLALAAARAGPAGASLAAPARCVPHRDNT